MWNRIKRALKGAGGGRRGSDGVSEDDGRSGSGSNSIDVRIANRKSVGAGSNVDDGGDRIPPVVEKANGVGAETRRVDDGEPLKDGRRTIMTTSLSSSTTTPVKKKRSLLFGWFTPISFRKKPVSKERTTRGGSANFPSSRDPAETNLKSSEAERLEISVTTSTTTTKSRPQTGNDGQPEVLVGAHFPANDDADVLGGGSGGGGGGGEGGGGGGSDLPKLDIGRRTARLSSSSSSL